MKKKKEQIDMTCWTT